MSRLTEKYWPEYCNKNRAFLSEAEIVADLVHKIRGSRSSLTWWTLIEKEDVLIYNKKHKNIVTRYYNIGAPINPHFKNEKESLDNIQLRILNKVWDFFNRDLYDEHNFRTRSNETEPD